MKHASLFGALFLILYSLLVTGKVGTGFSSVIWFCDWVLLAAGVALLFDEHRFASAFFVQALLVQTPWLVDTLALALFDASPLGVSGYMFEWGALEFILGLRHFLVLPVLFGLLVRRGFFTRWRFHAVVAIASYAFVIGLSLLVSTPAKNTNCAFQPCIAFLPRFDSLLLYHALFLGALLAMQYLVLIALRKSESFLERHRTSASVAAALLFVAMALLTIVSYATR